MVYRDVEVFGGAQSVPRAGIVVKAVAAREEKVYAKVKSHWNNAVANVQRTSRGHM
jgi:hypothetical protein